MDRRRSVSTPRHFGRYTTEKSVIGYCNHQHRRIDVHDVHVVQRSVTPATNQPRKNLQWSGDSKKYADVDAMPLQTPRNAVKLGVQLKVISNPIGKPWR